MKREISFTLMLCAYLWQQLVANVLNYIDALIDPFYHTVWILMLSISGVIHRSSTLNVSRFSRYIFFFFFVNTLRNSNSMVSFLLLLIPRFISIRRMRISNSKKIFAVYIIYILSLGHLALESFNCKQIYVSQRCSDTDSIILSKP